MTDYAAREKAEFDAFNQRRQREGGLALMEIRDMGYHKFDNGVSMQWSVQEKYRSYPYRRVRPGSFILNVNGKEITFDAEEFRRWLRWC